jgi:hypothetical protein
MDLGNFTATIIGEADGEWVSSSSCFHAVLFTISVYFLQLVQQFVAGAPVTLTFPQHGGSASYPDPFGGLISIFTRYKNSN